MDFASNQCFLSPLPWKKLIDLLFFWRSRCRRVVGSWSPFYPRNAHKGGVNNDVGYSYGRNRGTTYVYDWTPQQNFLTFRFSPAWLFQSWRYLQLDSLRSWWDSYARGYFLGGARRRFDVFSMFSRLRFQNNTALAALIISPATQATTRRGWWFTIRWI